MLGGGYPLRPAAGLSSASGLLPLGPQLLYLPLYLIEHQLKPRFELRPPVIGKVTGEQARLFEEYPHVL
jgi:hypothetical protein